MKRYVHKTNSDHKTTIDIGLLYPLQALDVMAGQTTYLRNSALFRFQPLISPAMVKLNAHFVSFFVPYRLLWEEWNDFISGQRKILLPKTKIVLQAGFDAMDLGFEKSILDYMGFPVRYDRVTGLDKIDLNFTYLWVLAYHKIWDEHFRGDDEIQRPLDLERMKQDFLAGAIYDGAHQDINAFNRKMAELYSLRRVNWGRDRFTSALLKAQTPDVSVPILSDGVMQFTFEQKNTGILCAKDGANNDGDIVQAGFMKNGGDRLNQSASAYYKSGLKDISLDTFREATNLYNFMQNRAIFGSSVEDYFKKYNLPKLDARLQRSEIIGGFAQTMQISDIIATSSQDLGKQGGHAVGYAKKRTFKHYAPEAGVIMTLVYLRPKADYAGGIPRFFVKSDMLDFFQTEFNSGYQPLYKPEVGISTAYTKIPANEDDMEIFGYEERYNEYRSEASLVTGELRPGMPLSHWANPRTWSISPNLNSKFLECNPSNQIWASPNTDKAIVWMDRAVTKKCFVPKHSKTYFRL